MNYQQSRQRFRSLLCSTLCEDAESYFVNNLLNRYPSVHLLPYVTEQDPGQIDGMTLEKARQILAVIQHLAMNPIGAEDHPIIQSPQDVFELMHWLQYADREHFLVLGHGTKNQVLIQETISIGSLNSSPVRHPRSQ